VTSKPDLEGVDAVLRHAREKVSGLKPVFGPVQAEMLGTNDAEDQVPAVDRITSLLRTLSMFNPLVGTIAEVQNFVEHHCITYHAVQVHPHAKMAWGVLSVMSKVYIRGVPDISYAFLTDIYS
jgi:hypothetical protein